MAGLKSCPFCKNKANLQEKTRYKRIVGYRVIDSNVECEMFPCTRWYDTAEEAIAAWNTRASDVE